jgi:methylmalonyl-CoA/ethylmalonyl-CoA epimerase
MNCGYDWAMKNIESHLDHIAIAVESIDSALGIYKELGFEINEHREIVESQKVKTAFVQVDSKSRLEFLEPLGNEGPIYDFLQKKGPGVHHLCFRVKDVAKKTEELKSKGLRMIYDAPVEGADNCLVNFVHPKSNNGVLLEISQKMNK